MFQGFIQCTDILSTEALDYQYHDIFLLHRHTVLGNVHRREDGLELLLVGKEGILANGAYKGEGCIKHEGSICRTAGILVGIRDSDGSHGGGESATHTRHTERGKEQQRE